MPKSEWKVCSQPFGYCGEQLYQVYRLLDINKPESAENKEFGLPSWTFSKMTATIECKRLNNESKFPKYVKTDDGYIGTFQYLDFGEFPVYRFPGGERVADDLELQHGSNNREELI